MNDRSLLANGCPKRAKAIEQVALTLQTSGLRKVAFASAEFDVATAEVAREVADVCARSGRKTLVIDLSGSEIGPSWMPGCETSEPTVDADGGAFHVLSAPNTFAARSAYNNQTRLAEALNQQFASYDLIVLYLAGLSDAKDGRINGIAAAAAADGIVIVCPTNEATTAAMHDAMELVSAAGGKVVGTVLDDRNNPMLSAEVARAARRTLSFIPPLARWAETRVLRSPLLRTPLFP